MTWSLCTRRRCLTVLVAVTLIGPLHSRAWAQAEHVQWDLVTIAGNTVLPGGTDTAQAQDGSTIAMTGSGTFVAPSTNGNSFGSNGSTTGGGTWATFHAGTQTGAGTYEVVGLVRWERELGHNLPPFITNDVVGEGQPSSGLAVLRIAYSDGSFGVLVVSCNLPPPRADMFEGITATKGVIDYKQPVSGVTLFHVR